MAVVLGEFEQLVMLTVLRLGDEAYSAAVRQELRDRAGRDVSPGAVFTTLERLEDRGLVSSRYGDPTPERGGRRKRYYRLRADGRRALARSLETVRRAAEGLEDQLPGLQRP
jgi:DNA-binding PadR family transcriptional regulator